MRVYKRNNSTTESKYMLSCSSKLFYYWVLLKRNRQNARQAIKTIFLGLWVAFCCVKQAGLLGETRSCFEVEFSVKHPVRLYQQTGWFPSGVKMFPCKTLASELEPIFCYCRRIERQSRRLGVWFNKGCPPKSVNSKLWARWGCWVIAYFYP